MATKKRKTVPKQTSKTKVKGAQKNNNENKLYIMALVAVLVLVLGIWSIIRLSSEDDLTNNSSTSPGSASSEVPGFLAQSFPDTDFSKSDPSINNILSGGPGKDGIPAIDSPEFVSVSDFSGSNDVQAIVIENGGEIKVYPYNILVWHEIVNDTIGEKNIAVTFCPLCGSAIVFDRALPNGEISTFGVSGALLESNMIMYDRNTESLWQQSTGKSLAGELHENQLTREKFQLLTMGEVKDRYPDAQLLSEDTGHRRDYARNPYSGYDESEQLIFSVSSTDNRYPSKDIFVAFDIEDTPVAAPWLVLEDGREYQTTVNGKDVKLFKENGELTVTDQSGNEIPFYFEMWFSWAVQNPDDGIVFDPNK